MGPRVWIVVRSDSGRIAAATPTLALTGTSSLALFNASSTAR